MNNFNKWKTGIFYKRGDVIYMNESNIKYYICSMNHTSDNFISPGHKEELYWIDLKNIKIQEPINLFMNMNDKIKEDKFVQKKPLTKKLKRKLEEIDDQIKVFKKTKQINTDLSIEERIKLLNVNVETKVFLLNKNKYNNDLKTEHWIKTALSIPFEKIKEFPINKNDSPEIINAYFKKVRKHLDKKIHKLDDVKDEIMEFIARKITNPNSRGHILALCGSAGVGKNKISKTLAEALELPFYQINFGGINDVSILTGHSETYTGSKPGKIVEILNNSSCINPILFLDEVDKISKNKKDEINGILTHLLDEEQNNKFQDNYLSNINIDASKIFFILSFNDIEKIDPIVANRLKIIHINPPNIDDKIKISIEKLIPEIIESFHFKKDKFINISEDLIKYIINNKVTKEDGVRQLKKCLEKIFSKLNLLILTGCYKENSNLNISLELDTDEYTDKYKECINISKNFIDYCLNNKEYDSDILHSMYM